MADTTSRVGAVAPASVRAWDLPTRLFKWTLVALVIAAPLTKWYGDITLYWHRMVGYAILTALVWRVLWGVFGSRTARFSSFVASPVSAMRYLVDTIRGRDRRYLGHNPVGGWMVLTLMAVLAVQATTGLFATDDIITDGPFKHVVTHATSKWLTGIHDVLPLALAVLVLVHVAANLAHLAKGENLIAAMISGRKRPAAYVDASENSEASLPVAALCLAVAIALVYGAIWLFGRSGFA